MAFNGVNESDIAEVRITSRLNTNYQVDVNHDPNIKTYDECWECDWSPDNMLFAWSCGRRIVRLVPVKYLQDNRSLPEDKIIQIDCRSVVSTLAFGSSRDHKETGSGTYHRLHWDSNCLVLAIGVINGRIRTYDVTTGRVLLELLDHTDIVRNLKFAPDGSLLLISASQDFTMKVWDLGDDGNMIKTFKTEETGVKHIVKCVSWSPDARRAASCGASKTVIVWDMTNLSLSLKLVGHYHQVGSCDFSPDGVLLITASYDTSAIVWNSHTGVELLRLGHLYPAPSPVFAGGANDTYVRSCRFSKQGLITSTVADDGYVRFWDLRYSDNPMAIAKISDALCSAYKPDGNTLAVGRADGSVYMLEVPKVVLPLCHLCRLIISRRLPNMSTTSCIDLPDSLKEYLKYEKFDRYNFH